MSLERSKVNRRKVTSVGDSWIVGSSKSHPGFTYYFNTLTGEAVWNLSAAEIEKAKQSTKHLEKLQGAPIKCPEPKDKPPSTAFINSEKPLSLSSEQFVINRISEQQSSVLTYSNTTNDKATCHTPFNHMSGVMQGTQIIPPSIEAPCDFNSYNNTITATPMVYNPRVWALPNTQVFIAPAIAPVVNHSLGPQNVALSQTVTQPATGFLFNTLENTNQSSIITSQTQTFHPREFSHDQGVKQTIQKNSGLRNKKDLRQKLLFMKNKFNKNSSIPRGSSLLNANINPRKANNSAHTVKQVEGIHSNDLGTGLESRCEENQLDASSKIDLEPLKCLAPPYSNTDAWYIVVDLEVLIQEFKFLTTLTDSDEKCHLMVPDCVMEELKGFVTNSENIQAKRILRFLSHQIEIGYAYMAEKPSYVEDNSITEAIHATCKELLDKKYHLIVLSNNIEIINKCSSIVSVFCIEEVKNILMEHSNKQLASSGPKNSFMTNDVINKIKIIVPNDVSHNKDGSPVQDVQNGSLLHIDNKQKPDESKVLKRTVDAGIQTDLEDINASSSMVNMVPNEPPNAASNDVPQNTNETITSRSVSSAPSTSDRRREIILKRTISHQPAVDTADIDKKKFKWRRRRNTSQCNETITSNNVQDVHTNDIESQQSNMIGNEIPTLPERTLNSNQTLGRIENKNFDESIESGESSIYAEPNSATKENVTIEETSTSGIISNTESNVDADSIASIPNVSIHQQQVFNDESNKVMYEVDSITMELYLRTKCDEWVSRFIQIMEEVLSQVLQQEPKFTHKVLPPPWTLHEAAQCITIKFHTNRSITSAANKLSNILFEVSDAKGKINKNMNPSQFMQMYSYGVHLLEAIMEVTTGCEDIQIAMESLNKLLHDIKNPNSESNTNDNDMSAYDNDMADVLYNSDDEPEPPVSSLHEEEVLPSCSRIEEVRNDEPEENVSCKEVTPIPVKFIRKIDIQFPLIKTQGFNAILKMKSPVPQHVTEQNSTSSQQVDENNSNDANDTTERGTEDDVPTFQPKFIRKFNVCQSMEDRINNYETRHNEIGNLTDNGESSDLNNGAEKVSSNLKNKAVKRRVLKTFKKPLRDLRYDIEKPLTDPKNDAAKPISDLKKDARNSFSDLKVTDNSKRPNDAAKPISDLKKDARNSFSDLKVTDNSKRSNDAAKPISDLKKDASNSFSDLKVKDSAKRPLRDLKNDATKRLSEDALKNDSEKPLSDPKIDANKTLSNENNKKFKYMMYALLQEIKSGLSQVQVMCHKCYEELRQPEQSTTQKYQLQKSAEEAQLHTLRLCRSLESMLDHEANNPSQNMSALLEQADIDIRYLDTELLHQYRVTVEKCKDYADEFRSSLQDIISDVKRTKA